MAKTSPAMTSRESVHPYLFGGAHEQIVERDQDLDDDQRHDDHFEPHAAIGIDDVTERACRLADDRELAGKPRCALLELVFIGEPGIEPVELGMIPQDVGLLLDLDRLYARLADEYE